MPTEKKLKYLLIHIWQLKYINQSLQCENGKEITEEAAALEM